MKGQARGQISLDLMMAVLVSIIVIGTLLVVVENVQASYEDMFIENQLKKIASESAAFVTSTNAMGDVRFTAELKVPKVQHGETKQAPAVTIDGDTITVSISIGGKDFGRSSHFSKPATATVAFDNATERLVVNNIV